MGDEYWTWQPHCPVILPVRSEHANTVALAGWGVFPIQSDRSIVEVRNKRTDYGTVNPPLTTALSWGSNSSAPYTSYCNKAPSPLCLCSYWSTAAHFFMHIQQSPGWIISWLVLHTPYSATGYEYSYLWWRAWTLNPRPHSLLEVQSHFFLPYIDHIKSANQALFLSLTHDLIHEEISIYNTEI